MDPQRLTDALRQSPNSIILLNIKAQRCFDQHHFQEAATTYKTIAARRPSPQVFTKLATCLFELHNYGRSIEAATRSLELDPTSVDALVVAGKCRMKLGELADSLADFDKALKISPQDQAALIGRGTVFACQKNNEKALADFSEASKLDEGKAYALFMRGQLLESMGRYNDALLDYLRADGLSPGCVRSERFKNVKRFAGKSH